MLNAEKLFFAFKFTLPPGRPYYIANKSLVKKVHMQLLQEKLMIQEKGFCNVKGRIQI